MSLSNNGFVSRNTRQAITSRLRLRDHNYREPGAYFLTLCLNNGHCLLGSISDSIMALSPAGAMVASSWELIPQRHPTADLLGYVIMPNHMHGIVILNADQQGNIPEDGPSLSDVVQSFKQRTLRAWSKGVTEDGWPRYDGKLWQTGYMEHVIRNDREMERLTRYIDSNVALWEDDTFHPRRSMG
jgi:REP element-mobilizing transposase RayT